MTMKKKPKKKLPEPAIKLIAGRLRALASEADARSLALGTRARFAQLVYDNGASLASVAEKLGWPESRIVQWLESGDDIDLRSASDLFWALGHQLSFKINKSEAA